LQHSSSQQTYNDNYALFDVKRRKQLCIMPRPGRNVMVTSKMNPCRDGIFATSPHSAVVLRGSKELYSIDFRRRERVETVDNCRSRGQFLEHVMPSREDAALLYLLYFDVEDRGIVGEVLGKDLPLHVSAFDSRSQRQIKTCKLDRSYRPFHLVTMSSLEASGHHFLLLTNYSTSTIRLYLFDAFQLLSLSAPSQQSKSKVSSLAQGNPSLELRSLKKVCLSEEESEQLRLVTHHGARLAALTSRSMIRLTLRFDDREADSSCTLV